MRPLFITAHYDDLEICAGGTAARFGGTSVVLTPKEDKGTEEEAARAAAILRLEIILPRSGRQGVADLSLIIDSYDTIIASSPWDSHPDHRNAANVARQVARKNNVNLWFMDHAIPGGYNYGPRPNHFVDTGKKPYIRTQKFDAIDCYTVITAEDRRAIYNRDAYYGITHGTSYAEGFVAEHTIT